MPKQVSPMLLHNFISLENYLLKSWLEDGSMDILFLMFWSKIEAKAIEG